ncbi:MAG: OmpA family protein [Chitinophagaceae bacterium]
MKKIIVYAVTIALLFLLPSKNHSQGVLNRLKQTAKNRLEDRADQKVGESVDNGLDKAEGSVKKKKSDKKKKNAGEKEEETDDKADSPAAEVKPVITGKTPVKNSVKFDFIPGEIVLYTENFSQDVLDEFPLKWYTDNKGVVVKLEGSSEKWMKMDHSSQFISPLLSKKLPDNFTVEFDLLMSFKYDGYAYPQFKFRLIENLLGDADGRKYMNADRIISSLSAVDFTLFPGEEESSKIAFQSRKKGTPYFDNEGNRLPKLDGYYGKVVRVSMWVQKQRMRLWIGEDKIYDVPQAIPDGLALNRIAMQVSSTIQPVEEIGFYITNIRLAAAGADMRSKLITEGRFETNGILFDTNSDKIKPVSSSVLKEIATVLKENPQVRVRIVGHTDSDGKDADNLDLSKRRAAAVKKALSAEYGIDAARIETDGQGESKPVADNATEEGKSKNRRVEFIKL